MERFCSDIIKDADEYVVFVFENDDPFEYTRKVFDEIEIANKFRQGSEVLTADQRKVVEDLTSQVSFLDKLIQAETKEGDSNSKNKITDLTIPSQDQETLFGMTVEEFEKKFKKIKKQFKEKRKKFEDNARSALLEAAKLYLGDRHTEAYVKYKLELNQSGLGSIMYQIHTMEETLHSLAARIKVAGAHMISRDVEVFTGLQRIILDAQKFQFDYLKSIEASMKELKVDYELANSNDDSTSKDDNIIYFRGSKEFLKQLSEIKNTMDDFVPTPSKNKRINPDAEIVDVQYEESKGVKELATGQNSERNPFDGYKDAPKKQRKIRDDEDEDDEDFDI